MDESRDPAIPLVRAVIVTVGVAVAVYVAYTVLLVVSVNATLSEAGLTPVRSARWIAQTSLGALFAAFAAFVARRSAYRPGVLTLAGFILAQGFATGYLNSLGYSGVSPERWYWARALVNWMAYAMALRTTQLFPRSITPTDRQGMASRVIAYSVGPRRVWVVSGLLLAVSLWLQSDLAFQLGQLAVLTVAVATMAVNYQGGTEDDRAKVYWLLLGGGFLFAARILLVTGRVALDIGGGFLGLDSSELAGAYGIVRTITWTLANAGLLTCLLLAVFYQGAIDPRLVLQKTAVYSFAVGSVVFLFAFFENYAAELASDVLGIREGILEAAAGATLALLLKPLYDGLNRIVEATLPATAPPDERAAAHRDV